MMKRIIWVIFVLQAITLISLHAAPDLQATFSTLTKNYNKALQKIDAEYEAEVEGFNKQYLRSLTKIDESVKANGDLQGLIKLRDERVRFNKEQSVPSLP